MQWRENGKTLSKYIRIDEREKTLEEVKLRKQITEELKQLKSHAVQQQMPSFKTNVVYGAELKRLIAGVKNHRKRDCYSLLDRYLTGKMYGRVCVLYGLRRTGKTTLLFQAINELSDEDKLKAAYIKVRITDTMSDLNDDFRELARHGYQYVFLDDKTVTSTWRIRKR